MDWDEIFGFCLLLGQDYNKISWVDFQRLIAAYDRKRTHDFEHTRAICYYSVIPYMETKDRVPIEEFWPLSTDPVKEEPDNNDILDFLSEVKKAYGRGN